MIFTEQTANVVTLRAFKAKQPSAFTTHLAVAFFVNNKIRMETLEGRKSQLVHTSFSVPVAHVRAGPCYFSCVHSVHEVFPPKT